MLGRHRAHHHRIHRDADTFLRQALDQIPTSSITAQQKSNFLDHIAKVFFFILQEFYEQAAETSSFQEYYKFS